MAVIGATERPGSWGSFIMLGLKSLDYNGDIFPVNTSASEIYGLPAYKDIREISGPVDLAVLAIPEEYVETAIEACGQKGVKGITIITAGYGEESEEGRERQRHLARLAALNDLRVLGPNVSGTFNLHAGFNASSTPGHDLLATPVAAVCQGGYAFYDMLSVGGEQGYGVGWFIHTGNEADLTITDFLEHFGRKDEVKAVVMYIETVRDGQHFLDAARAAAAKKPVLVYKAGRTAGSARAARSHTGALAGNKDIYQGLFRQTGLVMCPTMELLLPAAHALIERPAMRGRRVGIITVGGSWGVSLTDALEETGLLVPEFSPGLQETLREKGLPERASVRNPVDFGASGLFLSQDTPGLLAREILASGEVDALVAHGLGRPGLHDRNTPDEWKLFLEIEKNQVRSLAALEKEFDLPVLIGSYYHPWQSQAVSDLNKEGYRIYNRLVETAQILLMMSEYWSRRR
ncbi:MAG: CoA-binding protein [Thermodesulfobacteriota bacterium]